MLATLEKLGVVPSFSRPRVSNDNHQHKHSGLKFVTPAQRHDGKADAILRHREQVYEAAKQRCPERWSGTTRNWKLKDEVWLNPERAEPGLMKLAA